MKNLLALASLLVSVASASASTVFDQPLTGTGATHDSSWVSPNGTDSDMFVYDNFTLPQSANISEVRWLGGYRYGAPYGKVYDFTVTFYPSILGGWEPDVLHPIVRYHVNNNGAETFYGSFGGTSVYSYRFKLPTNFAAAANTKYWVQIEGWQPVYPDWGLADGAGGDRQHFRFSRGMARYTMMSGDTAFSLLTADGANFQISGSISPSAAGTVTGSGTYANGAAVKLLAKPKTGYSFVNWTENGLQVSRLAAYNFTANSDRSLVANVVPTISSLKLTPASVYGGRTSTGMITLAAPAIENVAVNVTSSSPVMAGVQNPVWIPAGSTSATFAIVTMPIWNDAAADITASLGPVTKTARFIVKAPAVASIKLTPSTLRGGASTTVTVTLTSPAPGSGCSVYITASDPSVKIANPYLWVNGGATIGSATLSTTTVAVSTAVTISATANAVSKSKVLTVNP